MQNRLGNRLEVFRREAGERRTWDPPPAMSPLWYFGPKGVRLRSDQPRFEIYIAAFAILYSFLLRVVSRVLFAKLRQIRSPLSLGVWRSLSKGGCMKETINASRYLRYLFTHIQVWHSAESASLGKGERIQRQCWTKDMEWRPGWREVAWRSVT